MLCSEIALVKIVDGGEEWNPLPCKRWSCPYCGPKRRRKLMKLAAAGEPNRMLTLTVNPALGESPLHRRQMLHAAWKSLTKRIMRKYRWQQLHYMAFIEKTKRGEPHLHILLRCGYLHQAWLSEQMKELTGSPIVWISKVENTRHAAYYVSKYVTKEPAQFGTLKRYWVSRHYELNKEPAEARERVDRRTTEVRRVRYAEVIHEKVSNGWVGEKVDDLWFRWWRPGYRTWEEAAAAASEGIIRGAVPLADPLPQPSAASQVGDPHAPPRPSLRWPHAATS